MRSRMSGWTAADPASRDCTFRAHRSLRGIQMFRFHGKVMMDSFFNQNTTILNIYRFQLSTILL